MADPVTGPCAPWATEADLDLCPCDPALEDEAIVAQIPAVSDLLYRMSGHQYPGACTLLFRPVLAVGCGPVVVGTADGWWVPRGIGATLAVNHLCGCSDDRRTIALPGPVSAVDEILIDGVTLDAAAYRVDNWSLLVRHDGGIWPDQDLELPAGDPGTWTVAVTVGPAPPPSGVKAAVAWACEFAKACDPTLAGDCAIPADARQIIRNGVTYDLQPADLLNEGRTGIEAVDFFLHAVNPNQLSHGSSVRSPDLPAPRVASWPEP